MVTLRRQGLGEVPADTRARTRDQYGFLVAGQDTGRQPTDGQYRHQNNQTLHYRPFLFVLNAQRVL